MQISIPLLKKKKSKIKPCGFKCYARFVLLYFLLLSKLHWNTKGLPFCRLQSVETSFCTRKQKRTNAALWLILINLIMKPNAVSSSFQYQIAFKMSLKVTFMERTSMKFWILWKPQTSLFINRDMTSIWTWFSWLREPVNRLSEESRFFTEWRSSC